MPAATGPSLASMAITGAHVLLYTPEAEGVRAVLRDVISWDHVDAGGLGGAPLRAPPYHRDLTGPLPRVSARELG